MLSAEENCSNLVEPPTEKEMNHAITSNMGNLMVVMRAVKRFKRLLIRKRPSLMDGLFGRDSRIVSPPQSYRGSPTPAESRSLDIHDRRAVESALTREGVHRHIPINDEMEKLPAGMDRIVKISPSPEGEGPLVIYPSKSKSTDSREARGRVFDSEENRKGHAHDPLRDTLYLHIGSSSDAPCMPDGEHLPMSESPPGIDINIYEQAYQDEMERILERRGRAATLYLNRRVEHREDLRSHSSILDQPREVAKAAGAKAAFKLGGLASKTGGSGGLADLVRQAKEKGQADAGADAPDADGAGQSSGAAVDGGGEKAAPY